MAVHGTLSEADLEHLDQPYVALSYTWDSAVEEPKQETESQPCYTLYLTDEGASRVCDNGKSSPATLNNTPLPERHHLPLTRSLSSFFKLHHQKLIADKVYLWIDAICINQEDAAEVSRQILLMDEVYISASQVWIWLGEEQTDLAVIKAFATRVRPALQQACDAFFRDGKSRNDFYLWLSEFKPIDDEFWTTEIKLDTPPAPTWAEAWASYYHFLKDRRWFSRVWTLQELVLARNAVLVCHNDMIEWEAIEGLETIFSNLKWRSFFQIFKDTDVSFKAAGVKKIKHRCQLFHILYFKYRLTLASEIHSQEHPEAGIPSWLYQFIELLAMTREMQTSVDKDYLYGILGLAKRFFPPEKARLLQINSNNSTADVFKWSCEIFVQYGYLHFLSLVKDKLERKTPNLPSWVVDWAAKEFSWSISDYLYSAAGELSKPLISYGKVNVNTLILSGVKIGELDKVYASGVTRQSDLRVSELPYTILCLMRDLRWGYERTGEPLEDAIRRTMTMDSRTNDARTQSIRAAPNFLREEFVEYMQVCFQQGADQRYIELYRALKATHDHNYWDRMLNELPVLGHIIRETSFLNTSNLSQDVELPEAAHCFHNHTGARLQQRKFFTTRCGLLGLCLLSASQGDSVWLVEGYRAPVILRPYQSGSGYEFMGEAYVHGAMFGEFMTEYLAEIELN